MQTYMQIYMRVYSFRSTYSTPSSVTQLVEQQTHNLPTPAFPSTETSEKWTFISICEFYFQRYPKKGKYCFTQDASTWQKIPAGKPTGPWETDIQISKMGLVFHDLHCPNMTKWQLDLHGGFYIHPTASLTLHPTSSFCSTPPSNTHVLSVLSWA